MLLPRGRLPVVRNVEAGQPSTSSGPYGPLIAQATPRSNKERPSSSAGGNDDTLKSDTRPRQVQSRASFAPPVVPISSDPTAAPSSLPDTSADMPITYYINQSITRCKDPFELLSIIEEKSRDFNQVNAATAYYRLSRLWLGPTSRLRSHPGFRTLLPLLASHLDSMNLVSITGILDAHLSLRLTPPAVLRRIPQLVVERLQTSKVAWEDLGLFLLLFCRVYGAPGGWTPSAAANTSDISDLLLSKRTPNTDPSDASGANAEEDAASSSGPKQGSGGLASEADIAQCFSALCSQTHLRILNQPPKGFVAALLVSDGVASTCPEARQLFDRCLEVLRSGDQNPLLADPRWDARSTCVLLYALANTSVKDGKILERITEAVLTHMEGRAKRPEPPPDRRPSSHSTPATPASSAKPASPRARKHRPERQLPWVTWDRLYEFEVSRTAYSLAKALEKLVLASASLEVGGSAQNPFESRSRDPTRGAASPHEQATIEETLQLAFEQSASEVLGADAVGGKGDRPDLISSLDFEMRLREFSKGPAESLILRTLGVFADRFPSDPRTFSFRSLASIMYAYALTQGHYPPLLSSCEQRMKQLLQRMAPQELQHGDSSGAYERSAVNVSSSASPSSSSGGAPPGPDSSWIDPLEGLRPSNFNSQSFGSIVWAFAKLDWSTTLLPRLAHIALNARDRYYKLHGPSASSFFHSDAPAATMPIVAYAQIASGPGQPQICHDLMLAIADDVARAKDNLNSRTIANVLWSLAVAELYPRDTWRYLKSALDRYSAADLGTRELWQIHLANVAFGLECSWREEPGTSPVQPLTTSEGQSLLGQLYNRGQLAMAAQEQWNKGKVFSRKVVSLLHLDVAKALQSICTSLGLDYSFEYVGAIYQIDLAIPDYKIAIEVDGPTHFTANTQELTGSTRLKRRILTKSGWIVIPVSHFEWSNLRGGDDRALWLKRQVQQALRQRKQEKEEAAAAVAERAAAQSQIAAEKPHTEKPQPSKMSTEAARALVLKKGGRLSSAGSAAAVLRVMARDRISKTSSSEAAKKGDSGPDDGGSGPAKSLDATGSGSMPDSSPPSVSGAGAEIRG